jgi:hypothetical protein
MSTQSTPKIRHLTALTHHLARLSHSMAETEHKMADLQRLLLAMQGFGGGQAAQWVLSLASYLLERDN